MKASRAQNDSLSLLASVLARATAPSARLRTIAYDLVLILRAAPTEGMRRIRASDPATEEAYNVTQDFQNRRALYAHRYWLGESTTEALRAAEQVERQFIKNAWARVTSDVVDGGPVQTRAGIHFVNLEWHLQRMENGLLTAYEVSALRLPTAELVVLSACETGLGAMANADSVLSLARAFQVAGAQSVLFSLWAVPDEATQRLMGHALARLPGDDRS